MTFKTVAKITSTEVTDKGYVKVYFMTLDEASRTLIRTYGVRHPHGVVAEIAAHEFMELLQACDIEVMIDTDQLLDIDVLVEYRYRADFFNIVKVSPLVVYRPRYVQMPPKSWRDRLAAWLFPDEDY